VPNNTPFYTKALQSRLEPMEAKPILGPYILLHSLPKKGTLEFKLYFLIYQVAIKRFLKAIISRNVLLRRAGASPRWVSTK
jgi:hypothetical protein